MLIYEMQDAFNSPDYIYEIKFDGIRCIAYLDDTTTDLRNRRNNAMLPVVPELTDLYKQVSEKCILDGELIVLKSGAPDFFEIQRRLLMTDPFKIKITANRFPASLLVYDILYYKNKDITRLPLIERKKYLEDVVTENNLITVSQYIENEGIKLFELAKQQKLEGIVAKRKDSPYWQGKRSKDWIKCKVLESIDCVICGYVKKEKNMTSIIIGQYDGNKLIYKGHVTLGAGMKHLNQHGYEIIDYSPFGYVPAGNKEAVWIKPQIVCIVEYMPTDKGSMRLPVFKGIIDDKEPRECQIAAE